MPENPPKIYIFSLFDSGYTSAHSLIRELFDSPKTICPSFSKGDLLYALSKKPPIKPLHHSSQDVVNVDIEFELIDLETHVAFCNRHREKITPKKIGPSEALTKFCLLSGLRVKGASCGFLGPHKESKFNIHNTFHIEGRFTIVDYYLFNQALTSGVGSRKSYGYGLILLKSKHPG